MIVDHMYSIGNSHDECQDFSISRKWDNGLAFVCVADGCSTSHKHCRSVDVGARILALTAERVVYAGCDESIKINQDPIEGMRLFKESSMAFLGDYIITEARKVVRTLMSSESIEFALDSTLIFAIADDTNAVVFAFGDGVVSYEDDEGVKKYDISYPSNAPYYLAYRINEGRDEVYTGMGNIVEVIDLEEDVVVDSVLPSDDGKNTIEYYQATSFYIPNYKRVTVMSDGFTSFQDDEKNPIDTNEVVTKAINFKNPVGEFLQRRIKMMLKRFGRKNIDHFDDISIASIIKE
jgi:hypothetical protein